MSLAITLWPEWAWAIAHFGKDVENRSWPPPPFIIGKRIAIHAGKHIGGKPKDQLDGLQDLLEMTEFAGKELPVFSDLIPIIKTSAIVAVVKVVGCIRTGEAEGWYNGALGWKLADVQTLPEPVECKGMQGLWTLPDDVLAKVRQQLARIK
jgi:hypothetical protein